MDERTETQTILPAETEKLVTKQKQLKGFERIKEKESEERRYPLRKSTVQAFKERFKQKLIIPWHPTPL